MCTMTAVNAFVTFDEENAQWNEFVSGGVPQFWTQVKSEMNTSKTRQSDYFIKFNRMDPELKDAETRTSITLARYFSFKKA